MPGAADTAGSSADRAAFDALVETSLAMQDLLVRTAEAHGLSLIQLRLLGILRDHEPSMLQLARHLNLEKSSASGLVDRAQRRGLVTRTPGTRDRRTIHVAITPPGRQIISRIERALAQPGSDLLAPLSPRQRRQLTGLLRLLLGDSQLGVAH
jgi:DNA-binding MarR family transcriptional regulator